MAHRLLPSKLTLSRNSSLFGIVTIVVVGIVVVLLAHASGPFASISLSGSTVSGVVVGSDAAAYGGHFIQFGNGSTPTPTPSTTPSPTPTGGGSNPTGEFYIVGTKIVAPNGSIFFPQGANLASPDTLNTPIDAVGRSADAQAWGWNTVRLVAYCSSTYASWTYPAQHGTPAFESELDSLIQEYTSKHIVTDVTCFDGGYQGSTYASVFPQLQAFWTYMGNKYKTNPYVWFDPLNEAFWESPNSDFVSWYQAWYNLIRGTGAENIIVVDAQNAGQDAGWGSIPQIFTASAGPLIANGKCNILFAMHNYGGLSDQANNFTNYGIYDTYWQNVQNAGLAMIVEEFGYPLTSPQQDEVAGTNATLSEAAKYGIGSLWWAGISNDSFNLKTDSSYNGYFDAGGNNVNLSPAGTSIWNYDHTTRNFGNFTGSYSQSNCPSAK